jgi:hypothetical protein
MVELVVGLGLAAAMLPAVADPGRTPQPQLDAARGGQCVLPPEQMRRQHMDLLKHQRKVTVHEGVRGGPGGAASLVGCIDCHASRSNDSVLGSSQNFCQGCHSYAAVKLDCFECHNPRTGQPVATAPAASVATPGVKP